MPFISYPEISIFQPNHKIKKALRTGIKMTPYQQSFEINLGSQSLLVNFVGANKKFAFLELSLVYNKSDQHKTINDSYNVEVATQKINSLKHIVDICANK